MIESANCFVKKKRKARKSREVIGGHNALLS